MRPIKFRAWDKKLKYMGQVWLLSCGNLPIVNQLYNLDFDTIVDKPSLILLQYTGLKDCKGVEIYEGDVVKFPIFQSLLGNLKEDYNGKIIWCRDGFMIEFTNRWKGSDGETDYQDLYTHTSRDRIEVLGNIYKNPKLLK